MVPQVASNSNVGPVSSLAQSVAADGAAAGCPCTALKAQFAAATQPSTRQAAADTPLPGPAPFSLESLGDVGTIFFEGLHVAMVKFSAMYGPVCRWVLP